MVSPRDGTPKIPIEKDYFDKQNLAEWHKARPNRPKVPNLKLDELINYGN